MPGINACASVLGPGAVALAAIALLFEQPQIAQPFQNQRCDKFTAELRIFYCIRTAVGAGIYEGRLQRVFLFEFHQQLYGLAVVLLFHPDLQAGLGLGEKQKKLKVAFIVELRLDVVLIQVLAAMSCYLRIVKGCQVDQIGSLDQGFYFCLHHDKQ